MNLRDLFVASLILAVVATEAEATQIEWQFSGQLTDAQNLAFAVVNGNPISQSPQPGDLPLDYTGTLVVNTVAQFADFSIEGSFTSATRSYAFDITTPNVIAGLDVLDLSTGRVVISDQFANFDFDLVIAGTGVGEFGFRDPDVVPTSPLEDVLADGFITSSSFTVIPEPTAAVLLFLAGATVGSTRCR